MADISSIPAAHAALAEGRLEDAEALLAPLPADHCDAVLGRAQLALARRQPLDALGLLQDSLTLIRPAHDRSRILGALALLQERCGLLAEAEASAREAATCDPTSTDHQMRLASLAARQGDEVQARLRYRLAIDLCETNGEAHRDLGLLLLSLGRVEEALPHLRRALVLMPSQALADIVSTTLQSAVPSDGAPPPPPPKELPHAFDPEATGLRVVLLNTLHGAGGAALAAGRLCAALRGSGLDARLLVRERRLAEPFAHAPEAQILADGAMALAEAIDRQKHLEKITGGRTVFTHASGLPGLHADPLVRNADVVNLHWVSQFVDWESFFGQDHLPPMVWTLHDMAPFTGGCHYSFGCEGFRNNCRPCSFMPQVAEPPTEEVLATKERLLARWRDRLHVVTPSRWLADEARRSRLFKDLPVSAVPNCVDIETFRPVPAQVGRQRFAIPEKATVLLFVADNKSDPRKGFPLLRQAMAGLGLDNVLLVTAGHHPANTPPEPFPCMNVGAVSDPHALAELYAAADLTVLPTQHDNLPNVMLESLACGTPMIGSDVGGVPDAVIPGTTGLLFPLGDAEALRAALAEALSDRDRLARWRLQSRAFAEREFAPMVQAARYRAIFEEMLARSRS